MNIMFANVTIINVPITLELEYTIPVSIESSIAVGSLVVAPLGVRKAFGVVVDIYERKRANAEALEIDEIVETVPAISGKRISFARDYSTAAAQPLGQILRKMLPIDLGVEIEKRSLDMADMEDDAFADAALRSRSNWNSKNIDRYQLVTKRVAKKLSRTFEPAPGSEYLAQSLGFGRVKAAAERRSEAYEYIRREGPVADQWIIASSGCVGEDIKWLLANGYIRRAENTPKTGLAALRSSMALPAVENDPLVFLNGQTTVYQYDSGPKVIEVFRSEIEKVISMGKFVWLIYSETFEVEAAVDHFRTNANVDVSVYHGKMSDRERIETWNEVFKGNILFVIGTLDALFLPANEPGLIIIDEPQDCRSHATQKLVLNAEIIADALRNQFGTTNIYASALPSVIDQFNARYKVPNHFGGVSVLKTDQENTVKPNAMIVDMAAELKEGNLSVISIALRNSILQSISNGKPSLIYLNRKGYANYIFCRECGYVRRCETCGTIVRVRDQKRTGSKIERCEQCGVENNIETLCPKCGSKNYRPFGAGIKMIEEACRKFAPEARIALWEGGRGMERGEITYARLMNGEIDILIGTQAISKNIPFPSLGTLGFALAESGFNHPDPFTVENFFRVHLDLIAKAAVETNLILQTYQPKEPLWRQLIENQKAAFIESQLNARSLVGFPPFSAMIILTYRHPNIEYCVRMMENTRRKVIQLVNDHTIENFMIQELPLDETRITPSYASRLILRNFPVNLLDGLAIDSGWRVDVAPNSITDL